MSLRPSPAAGTFTVSGRFQGLDTVGTTSDVLVRHNSTTLFSGAVSGYGAQAPFSAAVTVAAGDTIEFSAGWGANANYGNDSTGLAATVTPAAAVAAPRWLVTDHLGTPRMVVDAGGQLSGVTRHDYLPFGEVVGAGVGGRTQSQGYSQFDGVRQRYTGKERDDETGLDYFEARFYTSTQGRFTGVDPMLMDEDRMFDPQRINAYAYARNNPLKFIDPDGANPKEPKVVVNRTDTTYKVQGKTADDAIKDASVKSASRHATGDKLPGETTWKYDFSAGYAWDAPQRAKGGGFVTEATTTDVTVTATITVDTPEWEDYATASPEEQQKWNTYSNDLKDHEEGHVEIAVKGATEAGRAVQDTTATGRGRTPQQAVNNAKSNISNAQQQNFNKVDAKVKQQSVEYDEKTKHGKIPRKEVQ